MFVSLLEIEIEDFLNELEANDLPIWGRMTPQHMVEHLTETLQFSNGTKTLAKPNVPEHTFENLKRFLMSDKEYPQGFVSPLIGEKLAELRNLDLLSAIEEFKIEKEKFHAYFEANPQAEFFNPTFGMLNFQQWQQFHNKHFYHHFKQFGLI